MEALRPVLDLLFPARCVGCGARPAALCPACLARAGPVPPSPEPPPPPGLDWWVAAFAYEGAVREALARVKYRNARSAVPLLAAALVRRLREHPGGCAIDVVTWPPTTAARRQQRGFDQAEHLARVVGRGLGVPVRACLTRSAGAAQTGRSAAERRRGPAFRPRAVGGLRVLLVDDVATTGTTLAAAAAALRAGGAGGVAAATVARTALRAVGPGGGRGPPPTRPTIPEPPLRRLPEGCGSVAVRSRRSAAAPL
jgi:predicted amidophosphoribosyltransferase